MTTGNQTQTVSVGPGFLGLTFIVLLVLKLTGVAPGLTWFWVFSPLILGFVLFIIFAVILLIVALMDS